MISERWDKKNSFFKEQSGEVIENKGSAIKNKPETNQANLLKINNWPKNKPKTNRKTKRAILLKIKERHKTNRKPCQCLSQNRESGRHATGKPHGNSPGAPFGP